MSPQITSNGSLHANIEEYPSSSHRGLSISKQKESAANDKLVTDSSDNLLSPSYYNVEQSSSWYLSMLSGDDESIATADLMLDSESDVSNDSSKVLSSLQDLSLLNYESIATEDLLDIESECDSLSEQHPSCSLNHDSSECAVSVNGLGGIRADKFRDDETISTEDLLDDIESECDSLLEQSPSCSLNHDFNDCAAPVNGLGDAVNGNIRKNSNTLKRIESSSSLTLGDIFGGNGEAVEQTQAYSSLTVLDSTLDFRQNKGSSALKKCTSAEYASNLMCSTSSPSKLCLIPSGKSTCTAIGFANQCLVRSYERRYSPSLSHKSYTSSQCTNLSLEPSSPLITNTPMSLSVEDLLYEVSQSSYKERDIKRKLELMKIKYSLQ